MRVLVTGAAGFIGAHVVAALRAAGHAVRMASRSAIKSPDPSIEYCICDFARDHAAEAWLPCLEGIDAVVNCAGILRERGNNTFDAVHFQAPKALYQACVQLGVKRVIQISALGSSDDGEFIGSKHRGDETLQALALDWTILRPSVVYSTRGSYGGTSLLRAMAALPGVLFLPDKGEQKLQPIHANDLAAAVVRLLENESGIGQVIQAVGPERISTKHYLTQLRTWLGLGSAILVTVPLWVVKPVAWLGEVFGSGPLGLTMYRMLQHGNVGDDNAEHAFVAQLGFTPRSLEQAFAVEPSLVQDRWHAGLYFLGPVLRIMLGLLWLASGIVGICLMPEAAEDVVRQTGMGAPVVTILLYTAIISDLLLGILALAAWRMQWLGVLMLAALVVYTLFIGIAMPAAWLEPFGGLIKNIALIPAVMIMMVLAKRR